MSTFAARAYREIEYMQAVDFLDDDQLKRLLEGNGLSIAGKVEALRERARAHDLKLRVSGMRAIVAKAREMLTVMARLDREVAFRPGSSLGLMLQQTNEWAIVKTTPPRWESKVRVGDVVCAVSGKDVLLKSYDEMYKAVARAKASNVPYTLTFRRAPFHRGWLYKKSRGKSNGIFSGLSGWKRRFFVLAYGILAYYDEEPSGGGKRKGFYSLECSGSDQTLVTSAPAQFMSKTDNEPGLMLVKGDDRMVMKSCSNPSDIHNWAGLLYIAVAHANGGNDVMRAQERRRLATIELARATNIRAPAPPARAAARAAEVVPAPLRALDSPDHRTLGGAFATDGGAGPAKPPLLSKTKSKPRMSVPRIEPATASLVVDEDDADDTDDALFTVEPEQWNNDDEPPPIESTNFSQLNITEHGTIDF